MRADTENFSFNPREVYLELENGERIQASKYLRPKLKLGSPNPNWRVGSIMQGSNKDSYMWSVEEYEKEVYEYFEAERKKWLGFAIRFDTLTPNPGVPFAIEIDGLKFLDEKVSVPKIFFKDKKIHRELDF